MTGSVERPNLDALLAEAEGEQAWLLKQRQYHIEVRERLKWIKRFIRVAEQARDDLLSLALLERAARVTGRPSGRCAAQDLLGDARPFVLGALAAIETAQPLLEAIDAVLASPCCVSAADQEQVKEALEFYAESKNWTQPTSWGGRIWDEDGKATRDGGKVARAALALFGSHQEEEQNG